MMPMMPSTMPPPIPPDTLIWMQRNRIYPHQVWWMLASFIGLVAIAQFLSWIGSKVFSTCKARMADAETSGRSGKTRKLQLSRLPLAVVNWWRVFAFRNSAEFGELLSITYAEAFITIGYVVALFTWEFINSTTLAPICFIYAHANVCFCLATNLAGQPLNWLYYSGRTGALAVSQFPLVTVLGTKNNLLACECMRIILGTEYEHRAARHHGCELRQGDVVQLTRIGYELTIAYAAELPSSDDSSRQLDPALDPCWC